MCLVDTIIPAAKRMPTVAYAFDSKGRLDTDVATFQRMRPLLWGVTQAAHRTSIRMHPIRSGIRVRHKDEPNSCRRQLACIPDSHAKFLNKSVNHAADAH